MGWYNLDIILAFFFLISPISLLLLFNVDNFLPFIDHWNQQNLIDPVEIEFRGKKKLHLFDAGTKSGDQKFIQGRLVDEKYLSIRFLKGERKQKVTLICLKKKFIRAERKSRRNNWLLF